MNDPLLRRRTDAEREDYIAGKLANLIVDRALLRDLLLEARALLEVAMWEGMPCGESNAWRHKRDALVPAIHKAIEATK